MEAGDRSRMNIKQQQKKNEWKSTLILLNIPIHRFDAFHIHEHVDVLWPCIFRHCKFGLVYRNQIHSNENWIFRWSKIIKISSVFIRSYKIYYIDSGSEAFQYATHTARARCNFIIIIINMILLLNLPSCMQNLFEHIWICCVCLFLCSNSIPLRLVVMAMTFYGYLSVLFTWVFVAALSAHRQNVGANRRSENKKKQRPHLWHASWLAVAGVDMLVLEATNYGLWPCLLHGQCHRHK